MGLSTWINGLGRRGSSPPATGSKSAIPTEMPSDKLMEQWKRAAIAEYLNGGEPTWRTAALLAFAEGRRQAQFIQLPPPGADPVATDKELLRVARSPVSLDDARRAILRALGVEP